MQASLPGSAKPTLSAGQANLSRKALSQPVLSSSNVEANLDDWRTPILKYLRDPDTKVDKSIW